MRARRRLSISRGALRAVFLCACLWSAPATPAAAGWFNFLSAPSAELWERWTANDPADQRTIDHGAWDRFLDAYLSLGEDGIARIAYGRVAPADRAALDSYLAALGRTAIDGYAPAEQKAFWINLYNALTVRLVLDHYPVASIRDIDLSSGLFESGPWGEPLISVEGEALSLDDIEHRILRPIWRDARIHYAVNCASIGCPNLRGKAYRRAGLDMALDAAARIYVNHPRGVRVDGDRLTISSLYRWFEEDFGDGDAGVLDHLRHYAEPALRAQLARAETIDDDEYDWRLNDAAPER